MAGESIIDHKKWPYRGECKARLTLAAIQDEKMVDALASESSPTFLLMDRCLVLLIIIQ